jgi:hypothetical protein
MLTALVFPANASCAWIIFLPSFKQAADNMAAVNALGSFPYYI